MKPNFEGAPKRNIPVELTLERARALVATYGNAEVVVERKQDNLPHQLPSVLVDAASIGGVAGAKPLVRHLLVKDFHKIAKGANTLLPRNGMFTGKAGIGVYAIFDGTSCGENPGPMAAEYCARNFHTKLLNQLSKLNDEAGEPVMYGMLKQVFADIDQEILNEHPEIQDGCGVILALFVGDNIFTAMLGQCSAILCQSQDDAKIRRWAASGDPGQDIVELSAERAVRGAMGLPAQKSDGELSSVPWVRCHSLKGFEKYPYLVLTSSAASSHVKCKDVADVSQEFVLQPKAACTELVGKAHGNTSEQCTVVAVCCIPTARGVFQPVGPPPSKKEVAAQPLAKKAKIGEKQESFRLRHILVSFDDGSAAAKAAAKKKRTRQEAESLLREAIRELRKVVQESKKPPADAAQLVTLTTAAFGELCKKMSDCETAKKGGNLRGELGWVTPAERSLYGAGFKEAVDVLLPGQLSDIAASHYGLHLVQRMA